MCKISLGAAFSLRISGGWLGRLACLSDRRTSRGKKKYTSNVDVDVARSVGAFCASSWDVFCAVRGREEMSGRVLGDV